MVSAIVTDIEGTTSSLSFVKDVLFPYSRERLPDFVRSRSKDPAVQQLLDEVRTETGARDETALISQLLQWIDEDRKAPPLKALQGLIWETGYRRGDFTGHIYPDAASALRAWHARGLRLYVFSSGSVKAQQLLFGHTTEGDLTSLFDGYFDTTIGPKREPESYRRIVQAIATSPATTLFLSDVKEELDAARAAGMQTWWVLRDGETPTASAHPTARSFAEITF